MNRTLRQLTFAGLALCSGTVSGIAGESVVYHHGDWTVTITPRKSPDAVTKPTPAKTDRPKPANVDANSRKTPELSTLIRPVSFTQVDPATPPKLAQEPVPEVVAPRPNTTTDPALSPTPQALPPSPTVNGRPLNPAPCENCDLPIITPKLSDEEPRPTVVVPQTALYRDIYFSIPFNRVEYNASPSYRHDATMELLFNQMRPTVIYRGATHVNPYGGYGYGYGAYGAYSNGYPGYNGYGYGDPPYYPYSYGLRIHTSR